MLGCYNDPPQADITPIDLLYKQVLEIGQFAASNCLVNFSLDQKNRFPDDLYHLRRGG